MQARPSQPQAPQAAQTAEHPRLVAPASREEVVDDQWQTKDTPVCNLVKSVGLQHRRTEETVTWQSCWQRRSLGLMQAWKTW